MKEAKSPKQPPGGEDACIWVRVKPRASRSRVLGWTQEGYLEIQLKAVPERGKANHACRSELARVLCVSRERVVLEKGHTSRHKKIRILGVSDRDVRALLSAASGRKD